MGLKMIELTLQAIEDRHSIRSYIDRPIPEDVKRQLEQCLAEGNEADGIDLQLFTEEPMAFGVSKLAHYGHFEGVRNYVAVIGPKGSDERCGYRGEQFVLLAQQLGLNTCWVGLTFSKKTVKTLIRLRDEDELKALIAVGYGQGHGKHHTIKSPEEICANYGASPEWVRHGVQMSILAPTAMNQQKFRFKWLGDNRVQAKKGFGFYTAIDLGIAKLHFELGAAPHIVDWVEP